MNSSVKKKKLFFLFSFFFTNFTLQNFFCSLPREREARLGLRGSKKPEHRFFFFPPTMLPAWVSSSAPTPEPHQGFASSATVALVFFVLGVLVSGLEGERAGSRRRKRKSKQTMAREEELYPLQSLHPLVLPLARSSPSTERKRPCRRSLGEGGAEKVRPAKSTERQEKEKPIRFRSPAEVSIVLLTHPPLSLSFPTPPPSPDSAPQMAQRHLEHASDDPVHSGFEPGGAGV